MFALPAGISSRTVTRKLAFLDENLEQNVTFTYHIISYYFFFMLYVLLFLNLEFSGNPTLLEVSEKSELPT